MIRKLTLDDVERFTILASQLGYPVEPDHARSRLAAEALDPRFCTLVFEHHQSGVIGWVGLRVDEPAYRSAYGSVVGLVVDSAFRSQGYGAELLAAAEDWFRAQGVTEALVRSNLKREAAHRFYLREGYGEYKHQVVFSKNLN
jgi:GNAT superfamily N-acetyltransferase